MSKFKVTDFIASRQELQNLQYLKDIKLEEMKSIEISNEFGDSFNFYIKNDEGKICGMASVKKIILENVG